MAKEYFSTLPEFKENSARLRYLYSNWSNTKQSNPTSYHACLQWWKKLLIDVTPHASKDCLVLHADDTLLRCLDYNDRGIKPIALPTVIAECYADNTLIALDDFLTSPQPVIEWSISDQDADWAPWILSNLVKKPLVWALQQASITASDDMPIDNEKLWKNKVQGDYVVRENVDQLARALMKDHLYELTNQGIPLTARLFSYSTFKQRFNLTHLSPLDFRILLRYLKRDCSVVVFDSQKEIIKVLTNTNDQVGVREELITETEVGIVQVYETKKALDAQIKELEMQINQRQEQILTHLKNKQTNQAKAQLRSKKALQELLDKRLAAHSNLDQVFLSIESAASDMQLMRSYEVASKTLTSLLKSPELAVERVETTMMGLQEALADQREVQEAIDMNVDSLVDVDEGSLEEELKALQEDTTVEKGKVNDRKGEEERIDRVEKTLSDLERVGLDKADKTSQQEKLAVPA